MERLIADFEKGTSGNDVLTSDPGSANAWDTRNVTGDSALTYDSAHAHTGFLAAKMQAPSTSATAAISWRAAFGTQTEHYGRVYWYLTSYTIADSSAMIQFNNSGSGAFGIGITPGTGLLYISDDRSQSANANTVIALNQWVRLEWHAICAEGTGTIEAKLFNSGESFTPSSTFGLYGNAFLLTSNDEVVFRAWTTNSGAYWLDDIVANMTSYPGPIPSSTQPVLSHLGRTSGG